MRIDRNATFVRLDANRCKFPLGFVEQLLHRGICCQSAKSKRGLKNPRVWRSLQTSVAQLQHRSLFARGWLND